MFFTPKMNDVFFRNDEFLAHVNGTKYLMAFLNQIPHEVSEQHLLELAYQHTHQWKMNNHLDESTELYALYISYCSDNEELDDTEEIIFEAMRSKAFLKCYQNIAPSVPSLADRITTSQALAYWIETPLNGHTVVLKSHVEALFCDIDEEYEEKEIIEELGEFASTHIPNHADGYLATIELYALYNSWLRSDLNPRVAAIYMEELHHDDSFSVFYRTLLQPEELH